METCMLLQIPRFAFEKFPGAKAELTTQMKSVGEAMAMGRTFQESYQKALRSLETGLAGWSLPPRCYPLTWSFGLDHTCLNGKWNPLLLLPASVHACGVAYALLLWLEHGCHVSICMPMLLACPACAHACLYPGLDVLVQCYAQTLNGVC